MNWVSAPRGGTEVSVRVHRQVNPQNRVLSFYLPSANYGCNVRGYAVIPGVGISAMPVASVPSITSYMHPGHRPEQLLGGGDAGGHQGQGGAGGLVRRRPRLRVRLRARVRVRKVRVRVRVQLTLTQT